MRAGLAGTAAEPLLLRLDFSGDESTRAEMARVSLRNCL
jgi:hypothetical protein